jgi:Bifunctional DNA primase/polymerase, N-terminal/Primase C terminal 1 (PriCT-1)
MPDANIGIALDRGQCVVDIDPRHGGDGELEELIRQHGELPDTWQVRTGGGGRHYYFSVPINTTIKNSNGAVAPGIDLKVLGGYVIAPPSTHVSGNKYIWDPEHHPNRIKIAAMPEWLLALATKRNGKSVLTTSSEAWCDLVRDGATEGRRNSTVARITGHLLRRYVDPFVTLELMLAWNMARCDPALDSEEVTAIVNSVCGKESQRRRGAA